MFISYSHYRLRAWFYKHLTRLGERRPVHVEQ